MTPIAVHGAWRRLLLAAAVTGLIALVAGWTLPDDTTAGVPVAEHPFYSMPFGDHNPFSPSEWRTVDGRFVNWRAVPSARACAACHRQEFMEWNTSVHAVSDLDLIYDGSVVHNTMHARAAEGIGDQKGRWCEACHNPMGVLSGAVNPVTSVQETEALEEGVTCIVCHTASDPAPLAGNGALTSNLSTVSSHVHPALIMAAPERHARDMQARRDAPHMGQSPLCGACHTEIRPPEVNGDTPLHLQDTFAEWRHSPWAKRGIQCQDCHMARDPGAFIEALKRGEPPPHEVSHRIVGANYLLTDPTLPGNLMTRLRAGAPTGINRLFDGAEYRHQMGATRAQVGGLLRAAAELSISAGRKDGILSIQVGVTNAGAGHALPTGPLDQRHMWLELVVEDANGRSVHHSGAFDATTGTVAADAPMWVKEVTDTQGAPELRHTLFDADRLRYPHKPIPAGQTQTIDYPVALPPTARGPFRIHARLWYRLGFQPVLENIREAGLDDLDGVVIPPLLLQEATATITPALEARAPAITEENS